jgi:hypothetical protein
LSELVPERGKLIMTPPFSADISCTNCLHGCVCVRKKVKVDK